MILIGNRNTCLTLITLFEVHVTSLNLTILGSYDFVERCKVNMCPPIHLTKSNVLMMIGVLKKINILCQYVQLFVSI